MKNWVSLQIHLYKSLRKEVLSFVEKKSKSLRRYERDYLRDQRNFLPSDHKELTQSLNQSDLVFIGDYHTLRQSQRLILRLLRDKAIKPPEYIGLEVLTPEHLPSIRAWIKNPNLKAESQLREKLQLEARWGSNFETYKEVFLQAARSGIELLPLFKKIKSIEKRDEAVAKSLSSIQGRIWVLFGEYHCARSHLPLQVSNLSSQKKILVLQQNDDQATLQRLSDLSLKKTVVLKSKHSRFGIDLYCLLHTPLWIKYQSYLEQHLQSADDREYETLDAQEQIAWSLRTLVQFLRDPRFPSRISEKDLLDFGVFSSDDENFFKSIAKYSRIDRQLLMSEMRSSGVAVVPDRRQIYLSELTVNSCAQAAGLYLYLLWSGTRFHPTDFFRRTVAEAMAFFTSKLLNHSRRSTSWTKWSHLAKTSAKKREALAVLQSQFFLGKIDKPVLWHSKLKPFDGQSTVALGRNLADSAFEAFLTGEFSQARLIRILKTRLKTEADAYQILVELKAVGTPFLARHSKAW